MKSLKCLVLAFALAAVLVAAASPARAKVGQPSAVAPWIEFELNAIASHATNPPRAARALAHVSRAMYLAAVDGGRGQDDAVAGAASTVLVHLYPDETASIAVLAGQLGDVNSASFARGKICQVALRRPSIAFARGSLCLIPSWHCSFSMIQSKRGLRPANP